MARSLLATSAGAGPEVVLFLGEHVPAEHGQLPRDGDGPVTAAGADPDEEGVQRARSSCHRPRDLGQHRPGMVAADLADPPVVNGTEPRLAHLWIGDCPKNTQRIALLLGFTNLLIAGRYAPA